MFNFRACRFCKVFAPDDKLVKYGTRHYAHPVCYLDAGKLIQDLQSWQADQFPYILLRDRGLLDAVDRMVRRDVERYASGFHR